MTELVGPVGDFSVGVRPTVVHECDAVCEALRRRRQELLDRQWVAVGSTPVTSPGTTIIVSGR